MKETLTGLFIQRRFEDYVKELEEYLYEGCAVDADIILEYAKVLTYLSKFDESYKILKTMEPLANKYKLTSRIAWGYYINNKPKDTIRMLKQMKFLNDTNAYLLAKAYMLDGNYLEAKCTLNNILYDFPHTTIRYKVEDMLTILSNHTKYHMPLEMAYDSFKDNEFKLEKGHIVYLKNNIFPNKKYMSKGYHRRPFLIYKIEGDKLYLFPLTKNPINKTFVLKEHKYPYIGFDRYIVPDIYITTLSNVLSVKDKIYDSDYENALKYLACKIYNVRNKEDETVKDSYSDVYGKPKIFDVIVDYTPETKERRFYFVIGFTIDGYKVVEIDFKTKEAISNIMIYPDNRFIYSIKKLEDEERSITINSINFDETSLKLLK